MRTRLLSAVPFFVVSALVACSGSTNNGGNSVSGTVAGIHLTVGSALASLPSESCTRESDGGLTDCTSIRGKALTLRLLDRAGTTCANEFTPYGSSAELDLAINNEGGLILGAYDIAAGTAGSPTRAAGATLEETSPECVAGIQDFGTNGTITLTGMSATHVTGSYIITFGTDGVLSGSFDTSICDGPDASAPSPVCQQ